MMDLRINNRHILIPGRFYAIISPVATILGSLNDNPALQRYTTLFICSNFSRILNGINRVSNNFSTQRPFTAHQLLTVLRENTNSIVFCEHDASMYDDAGETKRWIAQTMKDVSRDTIFILYSPIMDNHFAYLASAADHVIIYENTNCGSGYHQASKKNVEKSSQKTLF